MGRIFLVASAVLSLIVLGALVWGRVAEDGSPSQQAGIALVAVTVPELTGRALQGKTLFRKNCAACHGDNAAGREGLGPPLVHKIYEPGHHGDGAFFLAVQQGVRAHHWPFGNMQPVAGLSQNDVENIIAYVRRLQRANGIN